ncbi:hypothetical protein MYP_378 [Sporocytophaga myxococcoides]|uniref:Uncharacterized protein n=1 Tax=Sporocytophaga myxococcoides TaxID=153721 RepID=A0A098L982_9BACT|nr:hypothetical protein [Sporocytophaga myxococcoides]GAL83152.1 hypothetical protein MYP_378 [Sporocytophaga myxococcoides]
MKLSLTFLALIISQLAFSQSESDKKLLKKDKYGEVYITHDTSRIEYKWLIPSYPDDNLHIYQEYYQHIKENINSALKFSNKLNNLSKWTPIYKINNKYYLYGPSDWMYNFGFIINDSTILRQFSDGPGVFVILNSNKVSDKVYQYKTLDYYKKETNISIYIIDQTNEIAVWKFETQDEVQYELMINSNNIKKFPLVIRNCGNVKCVTEYEFIQPDFEKLIKTVR